MTPLEIKICGIKDAANMDAVAEAGADWVGFVFFAPSPRALTAEAAAALAARHKGGPKPVGLFVAPEEADVAAVLRVLPLAALQVHGTAARAAHMAARFGIPAWHAVGVTVATDLPVEAEGIARLLLDSKAPPGTRLPGGNGVAFDWRLLRDWSAPAPWMLAGGLTPGNVAEAILQTGAAGVDVSSGVEIGRGVKDPALIHAFVQAARAATPTPNPTTTTPTTTAPTAAVPA